MVDKKSLARVVDRNRVFARLRSLKEAGARYAVRPSGVGESESFAFAYSTGRCGTLHLAKVFGDKRSYVCHEEEYRNVFWVMEKYLRPIAKDNDQSLARHFVRDHKIPCMLRAMRESRAVNYLATGHQIIFGIVPELLSQLEGHIKCIRLRRDRLQTALSFITAPEYNDPWMPHWEHRQEFNGERPRWALCPTDGIVHFRPSHQAWATLNRFQRYLWYVDEVERQWQAFLAAFSFPHIEVQLESLDREEYARISEFLGIAFDEGLIGTRHNATEGKRHRKKPSLSQQEMQEYDIEYRRLVVA